MEIIKVNYNNIYVSKPGKISPYAIAYRKFSGSTDLKNTIYIIVNARLNEDSYYINYYFDVYVNDIMIGSIDSNSDKRIAVDNPDLYSADTVNIVIKGYYRDEYNKYYFDDISITCHILPFCGEHITASEDIVVNNLYEGYLVNNNRFYLTKLNANIYTDEVINKDGSLYYDLESNYVYKYIVNTRSFVRV